MLLSLCYTVTLSLAAPLTSYVVRLLSPTVSNQAFNKRNGVWATWNNWTEVQSICRHNRKSVTLGLGKSSKGNIPGSEQGLRGEEPESLHCLSVGPIWKLTPGMTYQQELSPDLGWASQHCGAQLVMKCLPSIGWVPDQVVRACSVTQSKGRDWRLEYFLPYQ